MLFMTLIKSTYTYVKGGTCANSGYTRNFSIFVQARGTYYTAKKELLASFINCRPLPIGPRLLTPTTGVDYSHGHAIATDQHNYSLSAKLRDL